MNIKQRYQTMGLQKKVRLMCLLLIGICVVFCFGFFYLMLQSRMESTVIEKEESNRSAILESHSRSIDSINSMSRLLMSRQGVLSYLSVQEETATNVNLALRDIYDTINNFNFQCYVTIFRRDKKYVNTGVGIIYIRLTDVFDPEWIREVRTKKGGYVIKANTEEAFRTENDRLITFARIINDVNTQRELGLIAINVSYTFFERTFSGIVDDDNHVAFYDNKGNLIISDDKSAFPKDTVDPLTEGSTVTKGLFREKLYTIEKVPDSEFTLVIFSEVDIWGGTANSMAGGIITGICLIAICLMLINRYIARNITKPIQKLVTSMARVEDGWLHRVSMNVNDDEIGQLKNSYNAMLVQINQLIEELLQKERNLQKAELEALQEQIKPHFLYNTLDTIRYLALENQMDKVNDMLETLGNFFRKFLSKGSADIPLREEVGIVHDYLSIQKNRYEDVFEDQYELQDGVEDIIVPRLILQPFVENAIYHGVRLKGEKGLIKISVYKTEKDLIIKIYDSGVGMSKDQIKQLVEQKDFRSFGVKGTVARIQHYYKREDVFSINSVEGEYCEVVLNLPLNRG